jgi:hypothetical protein
MVERYQNSLSNRNLTVSYKGTVIEELTETLNFIDDILDINLINGDLAQIDINLNLDELEKALHRRVSLSSSYTVQPLDSYLALDTTTNKITITLNIPFEGKTLTIKDESYRANVNQVTIVAPSGTFIDGQSQAVFRIKGFGVQLVYSQSQWRII